MDSAKRRKMSHESHSPQTRFSNGGLALPKYAEDDDDDEEEEEEDLEEEEEEDLEEDGPEGEESDESATPAPQPPPPPREAPAAATSQPHQTNLSTLNDPVAIAGVDLAAEEEAIREGNRRQPGPYVPLTGRAAPINFVNKEELQKRVTRTASEGSMKTLKADTLDIIGAAVQQRLRNVLEKLVAARDHRLRVHATRPPPFLDDADPAHPAWDIDVATDVDKILAVMSKVDREEEKTARRSRIAKEEAELQQKHEAEQALKDGQQQEGEDGATTRKKREKEVSARNLTEDQQKKLTDASTRQMLFGDSSSKYSWLTGPAPSMAGGSNTTTNPKPIPLPTLPLNGLPAASSPNFLAGSPGSAAAAGTPTTGTPGFRASALNLPSSSSRLNAAATDPDAPPDPSVPLPGKVVWQDLQFAMQQERGHGAGQGTGMLSLAKTSVLRGKAPTARVTNPY